MTRTDTKKKKLSLKGNLLLRRKKCEYLEWKKMRKKRSNLNRLKKLLNKIQRKKLMLKWKT